MFDNRKKKQRSRCLYLSLAGTCQKRQGRQRKIVLGTVKELTKTQAQKKANEHRQRANTPEPVAPVIAMTVTELVDHYKKRELGEDCGKATKGGQGIQVHLDQLRRSQVGFTHPSVNQGGRGRRLAPLVGESQRHQSQDSGGVRSDLSARHAL